MAFENLNERERRILQNLITHYIQSADPVGSRVIANRFRMGISSATIRNTLQDLEELGLVEQPHTSAGRIPTDLGYRMYVDYLLTPEALTPEEKNMIKSSLLSEGRGIDDILGQTCRILGGITKQLGVAIAPRFEEGVLKRLELIPVSDERIMVVVVVRSGLARSVIIEIQTSIPEHSLREVELVLNERLSGLTLGEIQKTLSERLADITGHGRLVNVLLDSRDKIWTDTGPDGVQISGAEHLVQQPEFSDIGKLTELVKIIEDGAALSEFFSESEEAGLVITIGRENRFAEIIDCSLVTAKYKVGSISGAIGVVGPTRMPYNKLASVVEYTARAISDVLSGKDRKRD